MKLEKAIAVVLVALGFCSISLAAQQSAKKVLPSAASSKPGWVLTWRDEFNGADGSLPDADKWMIQVSGSGFGNNELEYYTDRKENIHIEKGNLVITAKREAFTGKDGVSRDFTSGRMQTKDHFTQQYGRFEARIKIPAGQGLWPAFWMLGDNIDQVNWPTCGEIDIMENVGKEPSKIHGTLHGPGYSGESPLTGAYTLPNAKRFADDYHVFAVEWEPQQIRFYVDQQLYETQTIDSIPSSKRWVFDHPFFLLLNLAVGGDWPGSPDSSTAFPAKMLVDYVRVYKKK